MRNEQEIKEKIESTELVIYLDECAAGVLSGDLFVCGLVIKKEDLAKLTGVNDSKKLTEKKRAELFPKIVELAVAYKLVRMTPQEVINELCKEELYKKYGFEKHKGYGTKVHMEALQKYGPIEGFHRFSYQPVKDSVKV